MNKHGKISIRYGNDLRTWIIRFVAFLQRKKIVILTSNPKLVGEVLATSDTKGTFLEQLVATPAWHPVYSIESMDGERWMQLSHDFKQLMHNLDWRTRIGLLVEKRMATLAGKILDSPTIARSVVAILYELLFDHSISPKDETLFYQASLEWRKEIAVKGKADPQVKSAFMDRLTELVTASRFKDGLDSYAKDPSAWISIFAQPFLISPQINISDIFVTVFRFLKADPALLEKARHYAHTKNRAGLDSIILESIRLAHPFPILERELKKDALLDGVVYQHGTQFFMLMDQFQQDTEFNPERWLKSPNENPYHHIPFAAGPRMCVGKPIAMELMTELLKNLLLNFPIDAIQPSKGHLHSGRDNDGKESLIETLYQLRVFSGVIWKSLWMGFNFHFRRSRYDAAVAKEIPVPGLRTANPYVATECPWKKMQKKEQSRLSK